MHALGDGLRHDVGDAVAAGGDADHDPRAAGTCAARYCAPSSTRWGALVKRSLSLSLAGSLSMPLTSSVPPWPRGAGNVELDGRGKAASTPSRQSRVLNAGRQGVLPRRVVSERHAQRTVRLEVTGKVARMTEQAMQPGLRGGLAR